MTLNLSQILEEILEARSKWSKLGLVLNVPFLDPGMLRDGSKPHEEGLKEVLEGWLNVTDPRPTWGALVKALRNPIVGETKLAERLEKKYCQRPQQKTPTAQPVTRQEGMVHGQGRRQNLKNGHSSVVCLA